MQLLGLGATMIAPTRRRSLFFRRAKAARRRASVYLLVLGASMIMITIGVSALASVRIERATVNDTTDLSIARLHARSAIELGFLLIRSDTNWRANRTNGPWFTNQPIDTGTMSLSVTDPDDGDLVATPNNFVDLTGTGFSGPAKYQLRVTLRVIRTGFEIVAGSWRHVVN